MRILVTGSRGLVGAAVSARLSVAGHRVVGLDARESRDVQRLPVVREAVGGCEAVVHAAALLGRPGESPGMISTVNVLGTWNVATAAAGAGVRRFVHLSSADVLGVFKGQRAPAYLPLDATHPCFPSTPYSVSKLLAEGVCRHVSETRGLSVACLRPPGIWTAATYGKIRSLRAKRPAFEWDPIWEYGAFLDVRDLADACLRAVERDADGYRCVLIASSDVTTSGRTARELVRLVHPDVEWRGGPEYEEDPYRALIDIEPACRLLDWRPRFTWRASLARRDGEER